MDNNPEPNNQPNPTEGNTAGGASPDINSEPAVAPTTQTATSPAPAKQPMPKGLIIGLIVGGVAILAGVIAVVCILLAGGKVDYEATYNDLDQLDKSMDALGNENCYKVSRDFDDASTSNEKYKQYVEACVTEFSAVESAMNKFAQSSGAKHDEAIKKAFESFQTAFKAVYSSKADMENELNIYAAFHDFYLTISDAGDDVKDLEQAVIKAAQLFEDTKRPELVEFAKGFREKGLAYVKAIEKFKNSSSYSSDLYNEVMDKMEEFTDYIEENAPEAEDIAKFNADNMDKLDDAYYDLKVKVRDAYYDNL